MNIFKAISTIHGQSFIQKSKPSHLQLFHFSRSFSEPSNSVSKETNSTNSSPSLEKKNDEEEDENAGVKIVDRSVKVNLSGVLSSNPQFSIENSLSSEWPHDRAYNNIKIELKHEESVAVVSLNRPESLNALSFELMLELIEALGILDLLPQVGAIVITGKGKAFAAGADIKEMKDKNFANAYGSRMLMGWESISAVRKPIIAAVNGYALGGGCELAMMCDIIIVNEHAVFGQPEITLGVIPGMGGTQRLVKVVGKSKAMEMVLSGKRMNAEEAAQCGLASRMVKGGSESLLKECIDLGKKIASFSRPAVAMAKESINHAFESHLNQGLKFERSLFYSSFALEDQKEGMNAFVEKRKPEFKHS